MSEEIDFYLSIELIADALDEALAEGERTPGTNVWGSFWDRVTEGGPIPSRPAKPAQLQRIADGWPDE